MGDYCCDTALFDRGGPWTRHSDGRAEPYRAGTRGGPKPPALQCPASCRHLLPGALISRNDTKHSENNTNVSWQRRHPADVSPITGLRHTLTAVTLGIPGRQEPIQEQELMPAQACCSL